MAPFWMMSLYKDMWGSWTMWQKEWTQLHNVQSVLAKAVAGILVITEKLHTLATCASLAVAENTSVELDSLLDQTNQMLAFNGDVIALLGKAQHENCHLEEDSAWKALSLKRNSFVMSSQDSCIKWLNLLFGDDTDRLVKSAREQFRATQHRGGVHFSHTYHPYRRGGANRQRPFLGQGYGQGQWTTRY